jgi:hypothetical protein
MVIPGWRHMSVPLSLSGPAGEKVFEAYVENRTAGAWRVFWYHGPERGMIRILNITPHP